MKKIFTICLLMATAFTANAQKLNGSLGTYTYKNVCNIFTNLNWEVNYKFEKRTDGIYLIYYNPKVTVAQNSLYSTAEKNYSKQELGLSAWPQNYSPSSLNVSVSITLPNGKVELSGFAFSTSDPYKPNEDWVCATTIDRQEVNLSAFTLSVTKASYNPQAVKELDDIIRAKKVQNTSNTSNTTAQNSSPNNPLGTSQTSTTQTNSQIPSLESQYAKLGIPANTPTYSKKEITNQLVTQAGSLAGELINEYNANYDKKMARWQAESDANSAALRARDKKKTELKFKAEFLPLIPQAFKGDDNARMALYYASSELDCYDYVSLKQREEWLKQALANNNLNAILENSISLGYHGPESISALEKAANLGSLDAMMILASWYNMKTYKTYGVTFIGGDNPQKAIEWFTKSAFSGCPVSMYHLGMIYKYGKTKTVRGHEKKGMVIYGKEIINEKLAFEWFSKSIQYPTFKKSLFARSLQTHYWFLSEFDPRAYDELAKMYNEGKVVPKDQAKSIALKTEASNWSELKENEDIREMKRYN